MQSCKTVRESLSKMDAIIDKKELIRKKLDEELRLKKEKLEVERNLALRLAKDYRDIVKDYKKPEESKNCLIENVVIFFKLLKIFIKNYIFK